MEMIQDDQDLHAELADMMNDNDGADNVVLPNPSTDFDAMGTAATIDREIWQLDEREQQDNLLDVNDSSSNIFYDDQFPVLPDFPCMSSSSSSSSTPAPTKQILTPSASTSSSAASWAMLKSDGEEDVENKGKAAPVLPTAPSGDAALSSTLSTEGLTPSDGGGTIDCMDVMENFGYMDLLDSNEIWDPSSIFDQNPLDLHQLDDQLKQDQQQPLEYFIQDQEGRNGDSEVMQDEERPLDEMGLMFFEWLKLNKDSISAQDMRNIKIKRSTVECATKRLGSSKEGKKQLLKLILEWVAQYQLRKKGEAASAAAAAAEAAAAPQYPYPYQEPLPQAFQNPNPNYNCSAPVPTADPNSCFSPPPWMPHGLPMQPYATGPTANMMVAPPPALSYMGGADPYNPALNYPNPYNHSEYQMLDSSQSWNQSQITMVASEYNPPYPDIGNNLSPGIPMGPAYVADQYAYPQLYNGNGDQMLMRLGPSATKEARKKRMARQRQFAWHHHPRHQQQQNHQSMSQNQANFENCSNQNVGNWGYWPPAVAAPTVSTFPMMAPLQPMDAQPPPPRAQQVDRSAVQAQNGPKQTPLDKKQGWKPEKNLKFLLQKVLKQSDVGNLGRIVLPKKEAETHLPELETRDGISISMEDIGTSSVWNMRYRFWPNNKSRMYLLENTGDFVKANGLQEGDFIVLYSDMKCGKYLIRGVKVRQPGAKLEGKKPAKRNQRNATPSSPSKKQQKEKEKVKEKEGGKT